MNKSPSFINQISVELSAVEENVLKHILSSADNQNALSPQHIAKEVPYAPETVTAAIERLLTLGLLQVSVGDDLMD